MYDLKLSPEDFIVKEIPLDFREGPFLIFKLKKKEYNTVSAINALAKYLRISPRQIGFAGNKDKLAITEQYISIQGPSKETVLKFENPDIQLEYIGTSHKQISLGNLKGNQFEVRLKNCKQEPKQIKEFVNYFGEQRFSKNNKDVGFAILKKDFKKAMDLILESGTTINSDKYSKNDFVGCMQELPQKNISLYISAFQSYLWNKITSKLLLPSNTIEISGTELNTKPNKLKKNELPLVGFETELENSPYEDLIENVMKEESITQRDYIIPQLGHLSAAGNYRTILTEVDDLEIIKENDETYLLKFSLPKGSYATVLIRQLFNV